MKHAVKVTDGKQFKLKDINPNEDSGLSKSEGEVRARALGEQLDELEDLMFYAGTHSLLLVLQGMDTSGKDGTIRFLFQQMNGQGARVAAFKVPTPEELAHDFLWRVHQQTPGKGDMVIFNRSHYEDVLVVRVHNLVPKEVWEGRYKRINQFEELLQESNTIVVKCFLHIDAKEQEQRLLARENEVEKAWKLSVGDWKERLLWDDYQQAYEDVIRRCSTKDAPWHVIPANRKWYRNLAVAEAVVEALEPYRKIWLDDLEKMGEARKAELAEYRAQKS